MVTQPTDEEIPSGPFKIDPADASGETEAAELFSTEEDRFKRRVNDQFEQDMAERKRYANAAFLLTATWMAFLIAVTFGQWIGPFWGKGLGQAEFITICTTTTTSIVGVWYLVGKYLFEDRGYDLNKMMGNEKGKKNL